MQRWRATWAPAPPDGSDEQTPGGLNSISVARLADFFTGQLAGIGLRIFITLKRHSPGAAGPLLVLKTTWYSSLKIQFGSDGGP
jgi:hypothetical protein